MPANFPLYNYHWNFLPDEIASQCDVNSFKIKLLYIDLTRAVLGRKKQWFTIHQKLTVNEYTIVVVKTDCSEYTIVFYYKQWLYAVYRRRPSGTPVDLTSFLVRI